MGQTDIPLSTDDTMDEAVEARIVGVLGELGIINVDLSRLVEDVKFLMACDQYPEFKTAQKEKVRSINEFYFGATPYDRRIVELQQELFQLMEEHFGEVIFYLSVGVTAPAILRALEAFHLPENPTFCLIGALTPTSVYEFMALAQAIIPDGIMESLHILDTQGKKTKEVAQAVGIHFHEGSVLEKVDLDSMVGNTDGGRLFIISDLLLHLQKPEGWDPNIDPIIGALNNLLAQLNQGDVLIISDSLMLKDYLYNFLVTIDPALISFTQNRNPRVFKDRRTLRAWAEEPHREIPEDMTYQPALEYLARSQVVVIQKK